MAATSHIEAFEGRCLFSVSPAAVPLPLTPEVLVAGDDAAALSVGLQTNPDVAAGPEGVSLAVWEDTRAGGGRTSGEGIGIGRHADVYAARIDAAGQVLDATPIPISIADFNQFNPRVEWNGRYWLVAWQSQRANDQAQEDVYAVRVAPDGTVVDAVPRVVGAHAPHPYSSDDLDPIGPLEVVSNGSDWFVTWRRHNPAAPFGAEVEWFATRVAADGSVADPAGRRYLAASQFHTDIGFAFSPANGGQFLQAYTGGDTVTIRRYDAQLNPVSGDVVAASGTVPHPLAGFPAIAGSPAGWVVTWEGEVGAAKAVRVDAGGNLLDPTPLDVTAPTTLTPRWLDAAWDGQGWAIAYVDGWGKDLFLRRMPAVGAADALPPATLVADGAHSQTNPQLVLNGAGTLTVTFQDARSGKDGIGAAAVAPGGEVLARADMSLAAPSHGTPELASDGTNFLAVFARGTGYGTRLMASRLGPTGRPLDAEPLLIADPSVPGDPRHRLGAYEVVFLGGRYVVSYTVESPQGRAVYARQVGTDGTLIGGVVEMAPEMDAGDASVMHLPGGDRMILVGIRRDGPQRQYRYARIFDASLAPITEPFPIGGDYTLGLFALGGETVVVGDRWLATWSQKPTHDRPRRFVAYAFVGPDGTRTAAALLPGTNVDDDVPTVVSNGGESATEAMIAFPQAYSVVGQRIAAGGAPIGGQITLIDEPGRQAEVRSAFDGHHYVLGWTDQRNYPYPGQPRDDVFAARVAPDGTVVTPGGFPVADGRQPELGSGVAVNSAGQTVFAYRSFRDEAPYAGYRVAARAMEPGVASRPPRVTGVWVGATHWAAPFRDALEAERLGTTAAGVSLAAPGGAPAVLPWDGINQLSIAFDADVAVAADDLSVRGVRVADYPLDPAGFRYDAVSRTATWTLSRPVNGDKVLLDLEAGAGGVAGAGGGAALDGEWDRAAPNQGFPSGDGTAGGDFHRRFDALPGDVGGNGSTNAGDLFQVRARLFTGVGRAGFGTRSYATRYDVNGDGRIDGVDLATVRARLQTGLPAADPTPPGPIVTPQAVFGETRVRPAAPRRGVWASLSAGMR